MARLIPGSKQYAEIFGALQEVPSFTSELPEYYAITQAWADPSLRIDLGLDRSELLNGKLARDIAQGSKRMAWTIATLDAANIPSTMLPGVRELIFSQPIAANLPIAQVEKIFDPSHRPTQGIEGVVIGAALAAVGMAVPVVGQVASALVAIGLAIFKAVTSNKARKDLADAKVRAELYKLFPPLQVADSATDTQIARRLHAILQTQDWSLIFMPRFSGEWVGVERDKGFAFAPGKTEKSSDIFGQDVQAFVPAGGIGCIPNTGIITSVIQVDLDPNGPEFQNWARNPANVHDPRGLPGAAARVIDTGGFYTATAQHATVAWQWATADRGEQGNPLLYRLDPKKISEAWRKYFEGGIAYIKETAFPWYATALDKTGKGGISANANLEGYYAPAVFLAVGSWAGEISGGTTLHPQYRIFDKPWGRFREQIKKHGLYPTSHVSGAFLPILSEPKSGFTNSMGSQWDRNPNVKKTCEDLLAQQIHDLRHTLVCMYVRRSDPAFANSPLHESLDPLRRELLKRPERKRIFLADIPEDETLDGKPLREVALAAGVPPKPLFGAPMKLAARPQLDTFVPPSPPWTWLGEGGFARQAATIGGALALAALGYRHFRRKTAPGWI